MPEEQQKHNMITTHQTMQSVTLNLLNWVVNCTWNVSVLYWEM